MTRFCILLARTKRMASRGGATPPRDAPGGNAEAGAWQCARRCARSCTAKCKPARQRPGALPKKTLVKAWGVVAVAARQGIN